MKKITLTVFLLGIFMVSAFAYSDSDVPTAVKTSFSKIYPDVKKVKWGKEKTNFEVEFDLNKTEMSCVFDAQGKLLETESEIVLSALPKGVSEYVSKNYPGQKIKEASKIVDSNKVITYEAEVKEGDLIFDALGKFLRKNAPEPKDPDKRDSKK